MSADEYIKLAIEKIKEGYCVEEIGCNPDIFYYIYEQLEKEFGEGNIINCKCQNFFNIKKEVRTKLGFPNKNEIYYL